MKNSNETMEHFEELLWIVNNGENSETGGGHGQKGVEFQRHWAISHMFTLAREEANDFLVIFEAIQDVAVYDSSENPNQLKIYQIKKKDRNEWGWQDMTGLYVIPKNKPAKIQPLEKVKESTIGKLYSAVESVKKISVSGYFVSNAGCNFPLKDGGNAATTVSCSLADLDDGHRNILTKGLAWIYGSEEFLPDLTKVVISKTNLPVSDPKTYLTGEVHKFLNERSPRHANQAHALVDALLAKIGPLGSKTDRCLSFDQLKQRQGFSKTEFDMALRDLESVPDFEEHLSEWLQQLRSEGLSIFETTSIKVAATEIFRNQLLKTQNDAIQRLEKACDDLLVARPKPTELKPFFDDMYTLLKGDFEAFKKPTIYAIIALRAIKSCVDQN